MDPDRELSTPAVPSPAACCHAPCRDIDGLNL
ncbi:hypothetical protein LEMLEM_LOCUS19743 [Lemmus lemmus]